jgi:hypothetical protein
MQRHRRTGSGQGIRLSSIRELLLDGRRHTRLQKLPEPGSGIREAPRRHFNLKAIQSRPQPLRIAQRIS